MTAIKSAVTPEIRDGEAGFSWFVRKGAWGVSGWCRDEDAAKNNVNHARELVEHSPLTRDNSVVFKNFRITNAEPPPI